MLVDKKLLANELIERILTVHDSKSDKSLYTTFHSNEDYHYALYDLGKLIAEGVIEFDDPWKGWYRNTGIDYIKTLRADFVEEYK